MDELTKEVRHLYTQYPFPNTTYRLKYGRLMLAFFSRIAPTGRVSYLDGIRILEAGCGTGTTITQIAAGFPRSRVLGLDLTPASLDIARKNAQELNLPNLEFREDNILTMDLKERFEVVLNIGVLHHLADMQQGIHNLARHITDSGYLVLWLYGKYGRFKLNLNQRLFRILFQNVENLPTKLALAKSALSTFPREYVECHFNAPTSKAENNFEKSLTFAFENEAWLVDQFLHVNEQVVNMDDIHTLLGNERLKIVDWLGVQQDLSTYTNDEQLIGLFRQLPQAQRQIVIDLLLKPNYYFVVAQRA
jgi:SAM-dependent methyltransferase